MSKNARYREFVEKATGFKADRALNILLVGKLSPPKQHVKLVLRSHLIQHLDLHLERRLTILVSPPGFGKTTLFTQWFNHPATRTEALACWLSLDEEDGEPGRFLAYLILAIGKAGIDLGKLGVVVSNLSIDANLAGMVLELISAIERQPKKILVFLDDYHRVRSSAVDEIVEMLIEKGSDRMHLAVSARQRPSFKVSVSNARGQVNYLDAADLVMSEAEAHTILGPEVSQADLAMLHTRTEGWAVALQLARLWLDRGKRSSDQLRDFSGQSLEMAEYFIEQVVNDLPEQLRQFMLETAILERLNPSLANAVRLQDDSEQLLQQLAHFNALLVPLDGGGGWYRYHKIFSEFLMQRLQRTSSTVPDLHRRAARWLAVHDGLLQAVNHALAADDQPLAVQLVCDAGGWALLLSHGIGYARSLLRKFPALAVRSVPALQLMQAYIDAKFGLHEKAAEMLRLAAVSKADFSPVQLRDLLAVSAVVRCYLDDMQMPDFLAQTGRDLASLGPDDHLARAVIGSVLVAGALAWGDAALAARASVIAVRKMQDARSTRGVSYMMLVRGSSCLLSGRLLDAKRLFNGALAVAEEHQGAESALKGMVGCFVAQSLYLDNRLDDAYGLIERSLESLLTIGGWADVYAAAYEIQMRLALRKHGLDAAMGVLDQAARLAAVRNFPRLAGLVAVWRIEMLAATGQVAEARREAGVANLESLAKERALPYFSWRVQTAATMALAEIHFASEAMTPAWTLLHQAGSSLLRAGLVLPARRMQARSLRALHAYPDNDRMLQELDACLDFIGCEGGLRIILESSNGLEPVLQTALENTVPSEIQRCAVLETLLAELRPAMREPDDKFSASELNVLRVLRLGQPNKLIARALAISENTVKFHLKNIYRKLGVDSRAAAITAAIDGNFFTTQACLKGRQVSNAIAAPRLMSKR